jgi:hypothetical protein
MYGTLAIKLLDMAKLANPTEAQKEALLRGWEAYFRQLQVDLGDQMGEFDAIMRARVQSGVISIVAPRLDDPSFFNDGSLRW